MSLYSLNNRHLLLLYTDVDILSFMLATLLPFAVLWFSSMLAV